ncbi:MAG: hypothetical protein HOV67_28975 [Kribbellaceae bacterium]|nr:hypothetical protein [Kribbellaceae bacterium]
MAEIHDGTGAGLLLFLDWAVRKGELPEATAKNLQVAANRVLSIEEEPEEISVRELDADAFFTRFENKNKANYKTSSMAVYRSRFRSAVNMYLLWLSGDSDWNAGPARSATGAKKAPPRKIKPTESSKVTASTISGPTDPPSAPAGMVSYDVPLRQGLRARLVIPEDLTAREAERLAAFVRVLAVDSETQPTKES